MTFYKFAKTLCYYAFKVVFRIKATGLENVPKDSSFIICSNHRTLLDPAFIGMFLKPDLTFMAKGELFKVPVLKYVFKWLGAFPVNRGTGDTGALDFAVETLKSGKILAMFPEGTRSKDGKLLKPKSGAAIIASQSGADVVPVGIKFEGGLSWMKKISVNFGSPIKNEDLKIEGKSASEIKKASKLIMTEIENLINKED